jgi:hypothetical protein
MTERKMPEKWSDLTPGQQNAIKILAVTDLIAKIVMLVDIRRRPADLIRGPKRLWRAAAAVNTLGPLAYFTIGRRKTAR